MAERYKSLASDSAKNMAGALLRAVSTGMSDNDEIAPFASMAEQKPDNAAATRSAVSSADTGDVSDNGASAVDIGNVYNVTVNCRFSVASASAVIALAKYDSAGTPGFMGLTEKHTFTADDSWTDGTDYLSEDYTFDVQGASKVYPILKSISSGNVDIRLIIHG